MAIGPDDLREEDLLREAQAVIRPLPAREPRAGFAAMVALNARDRRGSSFAGWLRWSFGGLAVAGAAAIAEAPAMTAPLNSEEVALAQRLALYQYLAVGQDQPGVHGNAALIERHHPGTGAQPC